MSKLTLTTQERNTTFALASIFALRMLGLFMVMPIMALNIEQFQGANEQLIGLAIGIYGLAQACLQIPLGIASDYFGRKPIIFLGLIIFAIGNIIAANSYAIYGVIIGRLLQGAAAIGCVIMAAITDYTREQVRTRAMSIVGMLIGLSFAVAILIGPILNQLFGIRFIFWITAGLSIIGMLILWITLPNLPKANQKYSLSKKIKKLIININLFDVNLGVFTLHASLAALFLVLPQIVKQAWKFYLPVIVAAFLISMLLILQIEKANKTKFLRWIALICLLLAQILFININNQTILININLFIYFVGFNLLEASLPMYVAKNTDQHNRGAAMGIYSSFQFLGIFFGGIMGGWLYSQLNAIAVLVFCISLTTIWIIITSLVKYTMFPSKAVDIK